MMQSFCRFSPAAAAVLPLLAVVSAGADSIRLDTVGGLDGSAGSFELRLDFDRPVQQNIELQGVDSTGFFADDWSLQLTADGQDPVIFDAADLPSARAEAVYTGFVQGIEPSRTELSVRLTDGGDRVIADLLFAQEGLNSTFFSGAGGAGFELDAEGFAFVDGFTLAPGAGLSDAVAAEVIAASVAALAVTDGDGPGLPLPPSAVPSPAALGGGLLLLSYLAARRREDG